jgi:monothiol glutaredoxin
MSVVTDRIQKQLKENPVLLYMKGTPDFPQCGFSARAVQILDQCGAKYGYVNVFEDPEVRETLKLVSGWPTFPQLFVNGELVGGSDIMLEMFQSGELQRILEPKQDAKAASGSGD